MPYFAFDWTAIHNTQMDDRVVLFHADENMTTEKYVDIVARCVVDTMNGLNAHVATSGIQVAVHKNCTDGNTSFVQTESGKSFVIALSPEVLNNWLKHNGYLHVEEYKPPPENMPVDSARYQLASP